MMSTRWGGKKDGENSEPNSRAAGGEAGEAGAGEGESTF